MTGRYGENEMIQCPKCSHQLPDWAQICQFCQADLKEVARPKPDVKQMRPAMPGTAPWIWPAYYICAAYFILSGAGVMASGIVLSAKHTDSAAGQMMGTFGIIAMVIGAIGVAMGIGLIAKVEVIRGIVNIFCWIQIVASGLGLVGSVLAGGFFTAWGLFGIVRNLFDLVTAGLMIYLIGETD